jgi:hypothetical protein
MPCYDSRDHDCSEVQARLNFVTRAACAMGDVLEHCGIPIPQEAQEWWDEHQILDAERRQKEAATKADIAARKAALDKLTPEELALLGIRRK